MLVLTELNRCNNRRWRIRRWHARREPVAWRDWPAHAGATIRAGQWSLALALLGRRRYVDTRTDRTRPDTTRRTA